MSEPREGFSLRILDRVDSTNELLMTSSLEDYPLRTAVLARTQSKGRGRAGRDWLSTPGGMYLSVLFRPETVSALALFGAYCVVRLCRTYGAEGLQIRWPNDVYVGGKKLAGVLPQVKFAGARMERVVLGVGLNVCQSMESFPSELAERATRLCDLVSRCPDVERVARDYLDVVWNELSQLEHPGRVAELCTPLLEGLAEGAEAFAVEGGGGLRSLGTLEGLGERGELRLEGGRVLENLGPQERLGLKYT